MSQETRTAAATANTWHATVAVVDDDPDVLEVVTESLQTLGCTVTSFSDPKVAAEYLLREHVDAIVVDARMPNLDGNQLIKLVRSSGANNKSLIGMITGQSETTMMQESFASGANLFLPKPVTVAKLHRFVNLVRSHVLKNTRGSKRATFSARIHCVVAKKSYEAQCINLSHGGVLVRGLTQVAVGDLVDVEFELPGSRQLIRLGGKVIRTESDQRVAISFLAVPAMHRTAIAHYIAEHGENTRQ